MTEKPLNPVNPAPATVPNRQKPRRVPIRTCVACRTSGGKRGLLRIVRLAKGAEATADAPLLALDPTGKRSGRGAYVCRTPECVELALKRKSLERSLKTPVPEALATELRAAVADGGNAAEITAT